MLLERLNPHPRDKRIKFFSSIKVNVAGHPFEDRYYTIDGKQYRGSSVTTVQKEYFEDHFDAVAASKGDVDLQKKWARDNAETIEFGKMHHTHYENYMNDLPFVPNPRYPEFQSYEELPGWPHFIAFLQTLEPYWERYRTEWTIFSTEVGMPGTIDLVLRDSRYPDQLVLMIVDYKMKKEPTKAPFCKCGSWSTNAYDHNEDCSAVGSKPASRGILRVKANVDSVQVCMYTKILEDLYGARVDKMVVAYLHPGTPETPYPMYLHNVNKDDYHNLICDIFEALLIKHST
jgi:hypothetical protein